MAVPKDRRANNGNMKDVRRPVVMKQRIMMRVFYTVDYLS